MAFTKITSVELNSRGATKLDNKPTISAQKLKEEFDAPAKEIVAPAVNRLVDELGEDTAALNIGADVPNGLPKATQNNVQSILNAMNTTTQDNKELAHKHDNKDVLDKLEDNGSSLAYNGKDLPDVDDIEQLLGSKVDKIPGMGLSTNDYSDDDMSKLTGIEDGANRYVLPKASTSVLGGVKPDGTTTTVDENGVIHAAGGGGGASDAYKTVKVGATEIVASGEDTIEFVAGSNVGITPDAINKKITISAIGGGGGGGGTTDYSLLTNKPSINNIPLNGNVTGADLGLADSSAIPTDVSQINGVPKTRKINGKDLSTDIDLKTSDIVNDSNYAKKSDIKNAKLTFTQDGTEIGSFTANSDTDSTIEIPKSEINNVFTKAEWDALSYESRAMYDGKEVILRDVPPIELTVDAALSDTSENPVQNKVITSEIEKINFNLVYNGNMDGLGYKINKYSNITMVTFHTGFTNTFKQYNGKNEWVAIGSIPTEYAPKTNVFALLYSPNIPDDNPNLGAGSPIWLLIRETGSVEVNAKLVGVRSINMQPRGQIIYAND